MIEVNKDSNTSVFSIPKRYKEGNVGVARNVKLRSQTFDKKEPILRKVVNIVMIVDILGPWRGNRTDQQKILNFVLEKSDERGNITDRIPVEMKGKWIEGNVLKDGDKVIVNGKRSRRGLVKTKSVYLIDNALEIRARNRRFL